MPKHKLKIGHTMEGHKITTRLFVLKNDSTFPTYANKTAFYQAVMVYEVQSNTLSKNKFSATGPKCEDNKDQFKLVFDLWKDQFEDENTMVLTEEYIREERETLKMYLPLIYNNFTEFSEAFTIELQLKGLI